MEQVFVGRGSGVGKNIRKEIVLRDDLAPHELCPAYHLGDFKVSSFAFCCLCEVSQGCCNKLSQTCWLKTTEINSLIVLEARIPKSKCYATSELSREESVLCLFQLLVAPHWLVAALPLLFFLSGFSSVSYGVGHLSLDLGLIQVIHDDLISRHLIIFFSK